MMEKLLHHRLDMPQPIERIRPQAPRELCAIALKLLAKRPEERYQTPGQLAEALSGSTAPAPLAIPIAEPIADTVDMAAAWTPDESPPLAVPMAIPVPFPPASGRRRWLIVAVGGLIVLGLILLFRLWPRR
jgi:serine/threonine-protein kinase